MMEFLYFPNDKAEYIPAIITFTVFLLAAIATTVFFIKKSRKEEKQFREKYEHIVAEEKERQSKQK